MPQPNLNLASTQNTYAEALTVQFPFARSTFSAQVSNAGVYYQLAIQPPSGSYRDVSWEAAEHNTTPALLTFRSPEDEGFPAGSRFAGVRFRSAALNTPAVITVA